ncbi:MAG: hypothetical protein GX020_08165 [Firmicutes bacterium]|nr:hypothetical protein [Bacillota bacterium]
MEAVWEQRVKEAVKQKITGRIFSAFNTNIDVIVHLNKQIIKQWIDSTEGCTVEALNSIDVDNLEVVRDKLDFLAVIKDCLGKGKSFYIVLEDLSLFDWLEENTPARREEMGGQAGIIANQMAALDATSVVYTSLLSQKQANLFFPEVLTPVIDDNGLKLNPVIESANKEDSTKINWIFEYAKGIEFDFGGEKVITPRANRVILSTRPEGAVMTFKGQVADHLPELGEKIDVAFMAGYHYCPTEEKAMQEYLTDCIEGLRKLKQNNSNLHLHFEYVPMKDQEAEKKMLTAVAQEIQSFGINENEIKRVLAGFGFQKEADEIEKDERAFSLYEGALRIMETLGFERIQVHNLGYYVLVLKKPYPVALDQVRASCLYASAVNAIKAKYGGYVKAEQVKEAASFGLSTIGIEQIKGFEAEMKRKGIVVPDNFLEEGIIEYDNHYLMIVPAHVVPNPISTVGMGATISSSSYACEFSYVSQMR